MLGPVIDPREIGTFPSLLDAASIARLRALGWSVTPTERMMTYRTNWTLWHAFREAVQNSLDAVGHVEIVVDDSTGSPVTFISDDGPGFGVAALYLGERKGVVGEDAASKEMAQRQQHCLRGHYGEGMKLGVMPVLQASGAVFIRTAGLDATWVESEFEEAGQTVKVLARLIRRNSVSRGTTFAILGLDATKWNPDPAQRSWPQQAPEDDRWIDMRMRALPTIARIVPQAILFTAPGVQDPPKYPYEDCKVRQLLDLPGHLFVRDLWVEHRGANHTTPMHFGYNFWFDDVLQPLGGDRDRLQLGAGDPSVQHEMTQLVCRMPEDLLARWLDVVLVHDPDDVEQRKRRAFFEYQAFDSGYVGWPRPGTQGTDVNYPARILTAIRTALRVRPDLEIAWSRSTAQADELVHRGIFDVADRVPEGFRELLESETLVRSAESIVGALTAARRWTIDPRHLARFLRLKLNPSPDTSIDPMLMEKRRVEVAHGIARVLKATLDLLMKVIHEMTHDSDVRVFAFTAASDDPDLKNVVGLWNHDENTMHLRLIALAGSPQAARHAFLHELGHKISDNAADKSDAHARGIAEAGDLFASWSRKNPRAYDRLNKMLGVLAITPNFNWNLRTADGGHVRWLSSAENDLHAWAVSTGLLRKAGSGSLP